MPSPYSVDLRKRVMKHFKSHGSASLTSKVFSISRSIIYDWKKLKKDTGSIKAKEGYQKGYGHKVELKEFKKLVESNSGLTLEGLVKKSGIKMSLMTCSRSINKLNITRKKRLMDSKNEMKKKEKHS
jgi:transposase